jgi:hypothetical protein
VRHYPSPPPAEQLDQLSQTHEELYRPHVSLERDMNVSIPNLNGVQDLLGVAEDREVEVDPISRNTWDGDLVGIGLYMFTGLVLEEVGYTMSRSMSASVGETSY